MLGICSFHTRQFLLKNGRGFSNEVSKRFVELTVDGDGIALMSLKRLPVNSMNQEFIQEINNNLDIVQKNEYKGVVLTSGLPNLFSAGLDLTELNNPDPSRLRLFWSTIQDMFLKLYGSGATSAIAINGHAAAGACIISLLCDYRVMVNDDKSMIGLNDTIVGVVPRPWICGIMERVIGQKEAERALIASTMYTVKEALRVNLIDEISSDKEDAIEKCKRFIRKHDNIPLKVRAETKANIRGGIIKLVKENREEDINIFMQGIMDTYAQELISKYIERIKQRKSKK